MTSAVEFRSNGSRTAVKCKLNRSCNHRLNAVCCPCKLLGHRRLGQVRSEAQSVSWPDVVMSVFVLFSFSFWIRVLCFSRAASILFGCFVFSLVFFVFWLFCCSSLVVNTNVSGLPRWLSWLRHSAHRPGRSVGGAGVQFPGSTGRFRVRNFGFQGRMHWD